MSSAVARPLHRFIGPVAVLALAASAILSGAVRGMSVEGDVRGLAAVGHLVISEIQTGGASASDEFVEVYNPTSASLSLDGLELVYVTASGATVTRKALWGTGAAILPGAHQLVANDAGLFAGIADATYANGLAAAGGSLALRTAGSPSAVDAIGWGTAASTWLEASPAPAPTAGSSLERLPGGGAGSGQDTDNNVVDFVIRAAPDPQNSGSLPVPTAVPSASAAPTDAASVTPEPTSSPSGSESASPTPTATPTPSHTPSPSPTPTPIPTATPSSTPSPSAAPSPTPAPTPLTVAEARALPDGSTATIVGVSLTDSAFTEGGGYLADATAGIAVLMTDGTFPRGEALLVTGVVDDRYAQRTLRADVVAVTVLGPGLAPAPVDLATGSIGEAVEGQLISLSGAILGAPTPLSAGLAFEIDDGSGPIRVLVGPATGIDTSTWLKDVTLSVIGVVGQRDSSGSGSEGYRVQPRDPGDVIEVAPPASPTPSPNPNASPSPSGSPTSTASASPSVSPSPSAPTVPLVTIDQARHAAVGATIRVRGVVTLATGLVDPSSAVIADPSGAILVRTGPAVGRLARGQLLELTGIRSTKAGMLSLRVTARPVVIGRQAEPASTRRATGAVGEADESTLVVVRGIVRDGPRRTSGGGLSFTLNDGSGEVRVAVGPTAGITARHVPAGSWIELRAVVGQETTGSAPNAGYRLWPRDVGDVILVARPRTGSGSGTAPTPRPKPNHAQPTKPLTPFDVAPAAAPNLTAHSREPVPTATPGAATPDARLATKARLPVSNIPLPLAAGLAGVAGLFALAWRTGTMTRAATSARLAVERARNGGLEGGIEEDESYTPGP